ncbi:helix-turn-helix transcriptional regulator [Desulfoluna spongiiphila]|uniref:AraC-type DNA-binding protein n=1 Tax=Desulfoluna spongiiphila TaxID=419481 RepID=A0A1G5IT74_9BACT|nr:AraC family transcriptional regulator [Desulfoluna spongiiphila]SCY78608.1 AraC-type DNA-binding protein [Desulfoluna spongiiphila]
MPPRRHASSKPSLDEISLAIEDDSHLDTQKVPEDIGQGHTRTINIGGRIRLINRDIIPKKTETVHYQNKLPDQATVGAISLHGGALTDLNNIRCQLHHCQGNYHWGHIPEDDGGIMFRGQERSCILYLSVSHDLLTQFPESMDSVEQSSLWRLMTGREDGVSAPRFLPNEAISTLRDLVASPITTPWDWMRVEAKALEIISTCIFHYDREPEDSSEIPLSPEDQKKITDARDLLIHRMDTPPTIAEMAKAVGVNAFKLKKGFKQLYGTTLFAYLRSRRLDRAYELIRSGEMNVTEAAFEVGYANPSAFTSAFRKAYGTNPIDCRKRYFQVADSGPES